jgi:hypothetical protein
VSVLGPVGVVVRGTSVFLLLLRRGSRLLLLLLLFSVDGVEPRVGVHIVGVLCGVPTGVGVVGDFIQRSVAPLRVNSDLGLQRLLLSIGKLEPWNKDESKSKKEFLLLRGPSSSTRRSSKHDWRRKSAAGGIDHMRNPKLRLYQERGRGYCDAREAIPGPGAKQYDPRLASGGGPRKRGAGQDLSRTPARSKKRRKKVAE